MERAPTSGREGSTVRDRKSGSTYTEVSVDESDGRVREEAG